MLFYAKLNAVAHSFLHKFQLFNNTGKLEANSSKFTVKVPWIRCGSLTTQTNLDKFTVALPFLYTSFRLDCENI